MIDTHAHYDDPAYDEDREELLNGLLNGGGLKAIVTIGCNEPTSLAALSLAKRYDRVFAAAGYHPEMAEETDLEKLAGWTKDPKTVAIGEIGLDYHYDSPDRSVQQKALKEQLAFARDCSLPVVIHDRDAHGDLLNILKEFPGVTGVFHSYSGSWEMAKELLRKGWYISFSGVVTFKNARQAVEVAEKVPPDRFLTETDCPYLTPVPFRGRRNDSGRMAYTLEKLAEIRRTSFEEIERQSEENAKALFRLPETLF
ncbi:MAG: TatD family hydrolase [Clostridia bacterium]|nr:TatD family hydrolase [Clostridia bacterium]